jgi:hypothetical protein
MQQDIVKRRVLVQTLAAPERVQRLAEGSCGVADDGDLAIDKRDARIRKEQHQRKRSEEEDIESVRPGSLRHTRDST